MPDSLKEYLDLRVNVTTVGAILLATMSLGMYVQTQDARIAANEKTIMSLEIERKEQGLQLQRLTVQVEGMRVQLDAISRSFERSQR